MGGLAYGTIVILDIDCFKDIVQARGWSKYRPNPATGKLTRLVEELVRKWNAVVVYGLDPHRGTEEAVLEIPLAEPWELAEDLVELARQMEEEGVTVTIVARSGPIIGKPAAHRREAYTGPRRQAAEELRKLKRRGGGAVSIEGSIIYRSAKRPPECLDDDPGGLR